MTRTSFAVLQAAFEGHDGIGDFRCIATPRGDACENELEPEQKADAKRLLRRQKSDLDLDELRDIINCVLCSDHQTTFTHKGKVQDLWCKEFPNHDFKSRRSLSPYNKNPNLVSTRRRRSSNLSSSNAPPTPSTTASDSLAPHTTPPPQPDFHSARHERSMSTPDRYSTPVIIERNDRPPIVVEPPDALDSEEDDSPSVRRSSRARPSHHTTQSLPVLPALNEMAAAADESTSPTEDPEIIAVGAPLAEGPQPVGGAFDTQANDFMTGDVSTWAPWRIRSEVLSTLLEPIPTADKKGTVYAVKVTSRPYVKIGYTTRDVSTRLREIIRDHGEQLDIGGAYCLPHRLPLLQLMRLEALVHADLAYFQRDLRGVRKHREYFEVDIIRAQRSIIFWWSVMQDIGLEPGKELDTEVVKAITESSALDIETTDDNIAAEPELWHQLNADYRQREHKWKLVFKRDEGGTS